MIKKLKNILRRHRLARAGIAIDLRGPTAQYGTGGGGWTVCPTGIHSDSVVYSFGVGRDLSFDLDLIAQHQLTVHAFDPTPASAQWVRDQTLPPSLRFHDYGIADSDGEIAFYPPRKASSAHWTPIKRYRSGNHPATTACVKTLRTIATELGHERIDILKMDIEGGEYDVIDTLVEAAPPIHQLLVEFHHAYETIPLSKTIAAVNTLRSMGFKVFAISERTYEISLINPAHAAP